MSDAKWRRRRISLLLVLVLVFAAGCGAATEDGKETDGSGQQEEREALNWEVPDFQYKDQNGKPFGLSDLKGKVWLSNAMFTRCPDVCPPMTANMKKVQDRLKSEGLEVQIVSFSVDPTHDTPKVLKSFGEKFDADFGNWHFLTGYKDEEIQTLIRDGFKGSVQRNEPESKDDPLTISHPVSFFLVDQQGKVYERYDGLKPDLDQLVKDIRKLEKS
ncbi:lipoprotein [Kroppenstedtia guangzhouensis]|uniref:Lipoprotein n=1 Tax=Kroppenstedtia guangzhouensis TaxID=1274356 RepID=A0ABQ1GCC5_9BACL|nr:SCO family protein [Kroppenstedtia guangzhouensis]GGA40943.1 lipoprotein [Kroppenstedtia guangzhouensis]